MTVELEQLGERIAEQAAHIDAAMHRLLADVREFDERGGWQAQGARSCAHWLAWRVGWDLVTARERVRVARKLAEFSAIDDALRRGEVSYSKVRAMLRIATPANELLLLEHARLMTASQLETLCRKYAVVQRHGQDPHPLGDEPRRYVRRRDTDDGMVKIEAVLHPEEAELVWAMLNHAATQLTRELAPSAGSDSAESQEAGHAYAVTGAAVANAASVSEAMMAPRLSDAPAWPVNDSAESQQPHPAPDTTAIARSEHVDRCAVDGSAESHQPTSVPDTTVTGATPKGCFDIGSIDDSAESREPSSAPSTTATTATAVTTATAATVIAAIARSEHVEHCAVDDSAESHQPTSVPDTTVTGATPKECSDIGSIDDSAESRDPHPAPDTTATTATTAIARSEHVELRAVDDSAESGGVEFPSRSLLDRLLDEADALRRAEAVARGEPGTSSSISGASASDPGASSSDPGASSSDPGASVSDPGAERVPSALHQRASAGKRAFHRADALVSIAQGYLRGDRPNRAPIEVTLTVPASSLRSGPADPVEVGEMGESFLSREAARRLSCDAGVVEVVEDEHGAPLSVGRKRRTIAGALKRALRKRDATCTYPGCTHRIFLEGHHIKHWADGGETGLMNITLLCSLHHRFVHEYGYAIELGPDQRPRFRDPRGTLVAEVPERPVTPDLGWPGIRAANTPLSITADTIACGWDGTPVDYGAVVGHLVIADDLR